MTTGAVRSEVRLPLRRIAGDDVLDGVSAAIDSRLLATAQERRDILDLLRREMDGGHAFVRSPTQDHRPNLVPAFIVERDRGANEIRSRLAAVGIAAMAEAALRDEDFLTAFHGRGIGNIAADKKIAAPAGSL